MKQPVATTVHYDQDALLLDLMRVHKIERWHCDPTYSRGGFYKSGKILQPLYKFDINPQSDDVLYADCRDLPLPDESLPSVICDLPFIHAGGKASVIGNRFDSYPSQKELLRLYEEALVEFRRVLVPKGYVAKKVQDIVESGKQQLTHCLVWEMARKMGYYVKDLSILVARNRIHGHNHDNQQHLRKFHCYWMLLQKPRG